HTRFSRDWSSDVCSSDLNQIFRIDVAAGARRMRTSANTGYTGVEARDAGIQRRHHVCQPKPAGIVKMSTDKTLAGNNRRLFKQRSEERRVGKECRPRRER